LLSARGYPTILAVLFGVEARRYTGGILLLVLIAVQAPARADGGESAELQARTAFAAANYKEALDIYARLYAETLHPTYLRNIGRCYQGLGDPDRAISSFQEYLRKARDLSQEQRAEIERYIAEMEQMKRSRVAAPAPPPPPALTPPPETSSPPLLDSPATVTKPTSAPAEPEAAPVYTRWWFWATVAAVAAAGITTAVLLSADSSPSHGNLGALDLSDKGP
jgi:tetratricopeptide (TPR) repeat protein